MKKLTLLFALFLIGLQNPQAQNFEFKASEIDIPHEKFVLPNGLKLLVYEDHKAPIVAVNVWYHVGSKNEKLGKSNEKYARRMWFLTFSLVLLSFVHAVIATFK